MDANLRLAGLPAKGGQASLDAVIRHLRDRSAGGEARVIGLARFACDIVGGEVLAARNEADLDDRLDRVVEGCVIYHALALLEHGAPTQPGPPVAVLRQVLVEALGKGLEARLEQALTWTAAAVRGGRRLVQRYPAGACELSAQVVQDPENPPEVNLALLGLVRAGACLLAVERVLLDALRPARWLAAAVVDRWATGMWEWLRLVASLPGTRVPFDIVPGDQRLDLRAGFARTAAARQVFEQMVGEAERGGRA